MERISRIKNTCDSLYNLMRPDFDNYPDNYLVFDTETLGLQPNKHLITQLGYCLVKDRKAVDYVGIILDWTQTPDIITRGDLCAQLVDVKQHVEFKDGRPTGKKYHVDIQRMKDEGVHPREVLDHFRTLLEDVRSKRLFYVAHNGYHFDVPFLERHFKQFSSAPFVFDDNELFDTGMVEKGSQMNSIPWLNETLRGWSMRTYAERLRHVKWALDTACMPRYSLAQQYGLDMSQAHDAGFDCYICHLLFEEYRKIADGKEEPLPAYYTQGVQGPTPVPRNES